MPCRELGWQGLGVDYRYMLDRDMIDQERRRDQCYRRPGRQVLLCQLDRPRDPRRDRDTHDLQGLADLPDGLTATDRP